MGIRFTISRKIALGFGLFIAAVVALTLIVNRTLSSGLETNEDITQVYAPSQRALEKLDNQILRSYQLITQWIHVQSRDDEKFKTELRQIMSESLPSHIGRVDSLSVNWGESDQKIKDRLLRNIQHLSLAYSQVMKTLKDFASYSDPFATMSAEQALLPGEVIDAPFQKIREDLNTLLNNQELLLNEATERENATYEYMFTISFWLMGALIVVGIIIAIFVIRSIVRPVNELKKSLLYLGKGIYPNTSFKVANDEIGDMTFAVNRLVDGLKKTREFSLQVGSGNFNASYHPLSDEDELGHALLKMRDELAESERVLEQKVVERTNEVVRQKEQIENQKERVTQLYKDLTDSINYAKRIQQTILPTEEQVHAMFSESFIMYRPKDIVSGDFYWFKSSGKKLMFAAVDCTGHGVPGAFMSLVGHNILNHVAKVFTRPSQVLNNLNRMALEILDSGGSSQIKDGMDLAFCTLDADTMELEFSGAQNPIWIIRKGELIEQKGDKQSIGSFTHGDFQFTNHNFQLQSGDCVYIFSDGFVDQFGGPRNKKFMRKQFRELLISAAPLHMDEQKNMIEQAFVRWRGALDQVDDILVIGIRV
ncbi:MAG: SpoIIE family protein phosphatase [Flavobacteriales bacterium]|nr:SpoIIE family protein phosphatase [Flavobacteriales bacterium]